MTVPQSHPSWNKLARACRICNNQSQAWSRNVFILGVRAAAMCIIWQAKPLRDVCLLHSYIIHNILHESQMKTAPQKVYECECTLKPVLYCL